MSRVSPVSSVSGTPSVSSVSATRRTPEIRGFMNAGAALCAARPSHAVRRPRAYGEIQAHDRPPAAAPRSLRSRGSQGRRRSRRCRWSAQPQSWHRGPVASVGGSLTPSVSAMSRVYPATGYAINVHTCCPLTDTREDGAILDVISSAVPWMAKERHRECLDTRDSHAGADVCARCEARR